MTDPTPEPTDVEAGIAQHEINLATLRELPEPENEMDKSWRQKEIASIEAEIAELQAKL